MMDGDVSKVGYFLDIAISIADSEFKIKSLYSNDLILNIASKSKETVQKLKFLDSPYNGIEYLQIFHAVLKLKGISPIRKQIFEGTISQFSEL